MTSSNCCFLTHIQISQEAGQVVWYSHLFQNFPQFIVIHTVKGFGIVNKADIDVFLELLLFRWSSGCWRFDLWFLCLFENQLEHLEVHGSCIAEAWLGGFWALLYYCVKVKSLSHVQLFATPWTIAYQAPPSMGFSRQEYWSELPFLLQGIFPTQGLNLGVSHCRQMLYLLNYQGNPKKGNAKECSNYRTINSSHMLVK